MDNIRISAAGIRLDDTLSPAEYSRRHTPKGRGAALRWKIPPALGVMPMP